MIRVSAIMSMLVFVCACDVSPWVRPYERANLADPIMNFNRDPVSTSYMGHVHEAREGTRGAGITTGGGCGCN